jgi:hypothetical protein
MIEYCVICQRGAEIGTPGWKHQDGECYCPEHDSSFYPEDTYPEESYPDEE